MNINLFRIAVLIMHFNLKAATSAFRSLLMSLTGRKDSLTLPR